MTLPLVLLPAMMCDARAFADQILHISRDRPVVVAPVSAASRVEAIAASLLDHLPPRFALAGLSFGAIVAMDILRQAPDRVDRACLMAASPLAETPQAAAAREPLIVRAQSGRLDAVLDDLLPVDSLAPGPGRARAHSAFQAMARDLGTEVFVRQSRALQRRSDQQAVLRRCKVPTLIVAGQADPLVPVRRLQFLAELMPDARLETIEDSGHLPPLEQPEKVTALLQDWLASPFVLK